MSDVKPVAKNTFTIEEMQVELDAAHFAQEHCRSLWGASRGHSDWRKTHDGFIAGYKAKNAALQAEIEALRKDAERSAIAVARMELIIDMCNADEEVCDEFQGVAELIAFKCQVSLDDMKDECAVDLLDAAIAKEKQP